MRVADDALMDLLYQLLKRYKNVLTSGIFAKKKLFAFV